MTEIAPSLLDNLYMRNPKQIIFTFAAFDRTRQARLTFILAEPVGLPPIWLHKLTVPFAQLEDVKKAINACCATTGNYSSSFEGDLLVRRLRSLSQAGCLNPKEVELLDGELSGALVHFGGAGVVDFEVIGAQRSTHSISTQKETWELKQAA